MTEPHPLDPDSPLNDYERVVYEAIRPNFPDHSDYDWSAAAESTVIVTSLRSVDAHVCIGDGCQWVSHRDPLPSEARARSGDPQTSKQAALTIDNMTDRQYAVYRLAGTFAQPWTYDELIWRYQSRVKDGHKHIPQQEPSSIRSRAAELRRAGFIVEAGRGMSDAGRPCNLWTVA